MDLVCDNLSTHKTPAVNDWLADLNWYRTGGRPFATHRFSEMWQSYSLGLTEMLGEKADAELVAMCKRRGVLALICINPATRAAPSKAPRRVGGEMVTS